MTRPIPDDLSMLASFYRRWEPQEGRRRTISDDLKELFSEGKGNGFNAKAMRKAFAERYRLDHQDEKQREAREQTDDETELYLSALARVRESDADEPSAFERIHEGLMEALAVAKGEAEPYRVHTFEPASHAADLDGEGDLHSVAQALSVDTNEPEAPAASSQADEAGTPNGRDRSFTSPAGVEGDTDRRPIPEPESASGHGGGTDETMAVRPATNAFGKLKMNPEFFEAPHPLCRQPEICGGNSNIVVCETCRNAAANSNITAAIPIVPAETRVPHRGVVG